MKNQNKKKSEYSPMFVASMALLRFEMSITLWSLSDESWRMRKKEGKRGKRKEEI